VRGKFITVEGIEGVGKSTNIAFIHKLIQTTGIVVVTTREPGGTPLGEAIRGLLLDPHYTGMSPDCELQMMFAARAEHLSKVILPALGQEKWVLCDRFTDATYAYQEAAAASPAKKSPRLEQWVQGDFRPDLTAAGCARCDRPGAGRQPRETGSFRTEQVDFFERVRQAYLELARPMMGVTA
jgi:dTMP kinase